MEYEALVAVVQTLIVVHHSQGKWHTVQEVCNVYRWLSWDSWGDENYCDTLFIVHGGGYGGKT